MNALYIVERWLHGWLICAADGQTGIPLTAVSEIEKLFPKNAVMDLSIAHHYNAQNRRVIYCIGVAAGLKRWRDDIEKSLTALEPEERWFRGLDVGMSSAAIFAVFCDTRHRPAAARMSNSATPADADDFGRCHRLLARFPEWRGELHRVSTAYPDTKWPAIVAIWDKLEAATPEQQSAILRAL